MNLRILPEHCAEMERDVAARFPQEACGLVAGVQGESRGVFPLKNALASPHRYLADASEMARALWEIERRGWEVLAVYHSHPFGEPRPSPVDEAQPRFAPFQLIWARRNGKWLCTVWETDDGRKSAAVG